MNMVAVPGIGRPITQIALGCGRLNGRLELRSSARIVETALALGIRHFDTAPSYGMGTADEVLGSVLRGVDGVTITSKVGIPRPPYSWRGGAIRMIAKPVLARMQGVKRLARGAYATNASAANSRQPFSFSAETVRRELDESLRRLRRDRVEILLAHAPKADQLTAGLASVFESLVDDGSIGSFGVGVDTKCDLDTAFGSIWQSRWGPDVAGSYRGPVTYFFHGVLRYGIGPSEPSAAGALAVAMRARPDAVFVVSASSQYRLRAVVEGALSSSGR